MATRRVRAQKPGGKAESRSGLRGTRRRLSVVSDNKLIEGIATLGVVDDEVTREKHSSHIIKKYAGLSKKGYAPYNPRKRNQDSLIMEEHAATGTLFFSVFDGHGEAGDLVSRYFADRLAARTFANKSFGKDDAKAMAEETDKLEKALLRDASIDTDFSGTTAVMATIRGRELTVCNIGDSRIIMGRQKSDGSYEPVEVSDDHKPDRPEEQRRIEAAGGRVFAVEYEDGIDGPPRVWLGHIDIPGLAMGRSLGDTVAHTAGVISAPEVHRVEVQPNDHFMVVASDGLWEFMSNEEVINMIAREREPKKAVDKLIAEANERWLREESVIDDTTIIVAFMKE